MDYVVDNILVYTVLASLNQHQLDSGLIYSRKEVFLSTILF